MLRIAMSLTLWVGLAAASLIVPTLLSYVTAGCAHC